MRPNDGKPMTGAGHRKRLKERFTKGSLSGFHDYEVIELLLTYAIPRRDVKPVAKEVCRVFGGLKGAFEATVEELSAIKGIGAHGALILRLVREAAFMCLNERASGVGGAGAIHSAGEAVNYIRGVAKDDDGDSLRVIFFNSKNEILGVETLHIGPMTTPDVSARTVLESAFRHNARSMIFAHNTLDERPGATRAEREFAASFETAARAVDVAMHDYLIIAREGHISYRDKGWVKG